MPLDAGRYLGPYQIISPLGKGGMGEVYRAKDTRLERQVAIKVLSEHLAGNEKALLRFEREAKTLAALSNPNIVAIYDVGTDHEASFVAMELTSTGTVKILDFGLARIDRVITTSEELTTGASGVATESGDCSPLPSNGIGELPKRNTNGQSS